MDENFFFNIFPGSLWGMKEKFQSWKYENISD